HRGVCMTGNNPKHFKFLRNLFKNRNNIRKPINRIEAVEIGSRLLDYYISLLQNHPDMILVFSLDGKVISHNRNSINEYLGYRPKQNIPFKKLVSEENYALLKFAFQKAVNGTSERVEI